MSSLAAATLSGPTSTSFSIPGTAAQQAIDTLQARFPAADAAGASARVVFAAPEGGADRSREHRRGRRRADTLRAAPKVAFVSDPFTTGTVSPDGRVALAQVTYSVPLLELQEADREALLDGAAAGRAAGLTVEVGGTRSSPRPSRRIEAIGIAIAAMVLFITFGSFVAAGLPLLTALMGIGIGVGLITTATGFVELSATSSILAVMIGLAVSIDYALFILSRFRSELAADAALDPFEAIGRAVGTAGSAVVFAGLTVVIALTGLSVVGIPILTEMGVAAAVRWPSRSWSPSRCCRTHRLRGSPGAGTTIERRAGAARAGAADGLAALADVHLTSAVARAGQRRDAAHHRPARARPATGPAG